MATSKVFSIGEAIQFGWETTKKNFWTILVILLIPLGISWIISFTTGSLYEMKDNSLYLMGFLITLAGWIINIEISYSQVVVFLKLVDKKKVEVSELFDNFKAGLLAKYFLVSFLYGLIVAFGLILFIIPGIYFGIKYGFAAYIYVDKNTSVLDAFKKSAEITMHVKWQLLWFGILMMLITLAGALVFGVGLLLAVPLVYLAQLHVYRKLLNHKKV